MTPGRLEAMYGEAGIGRVETIIHPEYGDDFATFYEIPAGLAAAYYLTLAGADCTLFDDHERPGGMLDRGVDRRRLPQAVGPKAAGQIALHLLDLGLALGRTHEVPMPTAAVTRDMFQSSMGQGNREDVDFSIVLEFIANCSGITLESENKDVPTGLETD